jgi:hypothetical protein
LIFQTSGCDGEVDDGGFDAYLWYIVRIGEFGGQIVLEVKVIGHILISQSQQILLAFLL